MEASACRECGAAISRSRAGHSGRCRPCWLAHCQHCDAPLPAGRVQRRCRDCQRVAATDMRRPRHCWDCGARLTPERRCGYCAPCQRARNRLAKRVRLAHPERACLDCGAPVGLRPSDTRCAACARLKRAALRRRERYCCTCRQRLTLAEEGRCRACRALYENWYHRAVQGDREALALRPLRRKPRWVRPQKGAQTGLCQPVDASSPEDTQCSAEGSRSR